MISSLGLPGPVPEPFTIEAADSELADLADRLRRTRWAPELANDDWSYGTSGDYLTSLVEYWLDGYDWREQEASINAHPQYRVSIDGLPIHYLHVRGRGPDPVPIVLTHGWPWTFWDWHGVIDRLANPAAYGEDPALSFDVVVPSLPGYAFSTPVPRTGITLPVVTAAWDQLMRGVLGYPSYGAAGGDWGSLVTSELALQHPDHVTAAYVSFPPVHLTGGMDFHTTDHYAPDEVEWAELARRKYNTTARTHVAVQTADPQTLAWALNDSPVGLASWLLERRHYWSGAGIEQSFDRDFLLTTVMLYWLTQSLSSSIRVYADSYPAGLRLPVGARNLSPTAMQPPDRGRITVPFGQGVYRGELAIVPRESVERVADVALWSRHEQGGHFAPAEQPAAYAADVRALFGIATRRG